MSLFVFDRLIDAADFCNFESEKKRIEDSISQGHCLKLFAPRNFGKTSLIKNIIAKDWELKSPDTRIVIYIDFYSFTSIDEVSMEFTKAFNEGLSRKKNLLEKSADFFALFKKVRPVWKPPVDADGLGEFSIRTTQDQSVVEFSAVLENINALVTAEKFEFLIIFDEFQEIKNIPRLEAKLRESLQKMKPTVPVVVLGSKFHLLKKIFETPHAPFANWGMTVEMGYIPFEHYTQYANERLNKMSMYLEPNESIFLQESLNRIPEVMNKMCNFISSLHIRGAISRSYIVGAIDSYIELSRSIYSSLYAEFSLNERKIICALTSLHKTSSISGKEFLKVVDGMSKSGVANIVDKLMDKGTIDRSVNEAGSFEFSITDPLFRKFVEKYHIFR